MITRENYSKKRVAILEALQSTTVHPTAEWVYNALKPTYSDLSLGTVYRNIKKFCADGKVLSVGVFDGQEHFDGNIHPHSHFYCQTCGSIIDINRTFMDNKEKDRVAKEFGFDIKSEEVMLRGVCKNCLKN